MARNQALLREHGVLYPSTCRQGDAHHVLVCDLIEIHQRGSMPDLWYGDYPRGKSWGALLDEINGQRTQLQAVVISSELFFGQTRNIEAMLTDIREKLSGFEVKVIAYLRRQDQLYSSFFNQDIKGVRQWSSSAYEFYETHQLFLRNYYGLLNAWAQVFGRENILVRPYEPNQWPDNDVMKDFCALVPAMPALGIMNIERNEALGPTQLYLKRCLNQVGFDKADNDKVLQHVFELCEEAPVKNSIYINKGLYGRLRGRWRTVNDRISADFLDGQPLFQTEIPKAGEVSPYRFDMELLMGIITNSIDGLRRAQFAQHQTLFARAILLIAAELRLWDRLSVEDRNQLMSSA